MSMGFNAAALRLMADKGLSLADVAEIAAAMETRPAKVDRTNAERQARHRAARRNAVTVTAGPPYDSISNPPSPPGDADASPAPRGRTDRTTRLPDDFELPPEWIDDAIARRRWSRADAVEEGEGFCRYWQAKGGSGARKRDWLKTWQNWVANSRRPSGAPASGAGAGRRLTPAEQIAALEQRAAGFEAMGRPDRAEEVRAEIRRLCATGPPAGGHDGTGDAATAGVE